MNTIFNPKRLLNRELALQRGFLKPDIRSCCGINEPGVLTLLKWRVVDESYEFDHGFVNQSQSRASGLGKPGPEVQNSDANLDTISKVLFDSHSFHFQMR